MANRPIIPARPVPGAGVPARPNPAPPGTSSRVYGEPALAVNFSVETDAGALSVARIEGLGLAADAARLQLNRGTAAQPAQWTAPPLPGRLTLSRAVDGDRSLYDWRREALDGKPAMRTLVIRHLDRSGTETLHAWQLNQVWPVAWRGPLFDALDGGIAMEALDLAYSDVIWL